MINVKQLITDAKNSKKGLLELIVGIWTLVLTISLVAILVTGVDFLVKESKGANQESGVAPADDSPTPAPTQETTPIPSPVETEEASGEEDDEDAKETDKPSEEEDTDDEGDEEDTEDEEDGGEDGEEAMYLTTLVNMRSSASLTASIITKIPTGSVVARIDKLDDGWSEIYYEGREGYVRTEYLTKTRPNSTSADSRINSNGAPRTVAPARPTQKPASTTPKRTNKPTKKPNVNDDLDVDEEEDSSDEEVSDEEFSDEDVPEKSPTSGEPSKTEAPLNFPTGMPEMDQDME